MKILHTSDWHLGKIIFGRSLLEDQEYFIKESLLPALDDEQPDLVALSGDVFDRQIAPIEAIRLFGLAVSEICNKRKIPLAIISGNHDGPDRLAVYSDLLRPQGFFVSARPFDTEPIHLEDESGEVLIHFLPHFEPSFARDRLGDDSIHGFNESYRAVLSEMTGKFDQKARHVLLSHCFMKGASTCESESPLSIGGSGEVDGALFSNFSYVALGHLHGPQKAYQNAWYSGSPLKYSFDEEHHHKCLFLTEIKGSNVSIKEIPVKPLRNMRTVTGTVKELCETASQDKQADDYIYANLTDERPVYEPMAALREHYPNILGLSPGWLTGGAFGGERDMLREKLRKKSAGDLLFFEEFLRQVCGVEPSKEDIDIFSQALKSLDTEASV